MKNKRIKNILINHLIRNGNKKTCETVLLKSFKNIQKFCKKPHKTLLKLSIIKSTSTFRLIQLKNKKRKKNKIKNSKEIPLFISSNYKRISWALKYILETTKKKTANKFYKNLKQEIISSSQNEGDSTKIKTNLHKQIITRKRLFLYFRW